VLRALVLPLVQGLPINQGMAMKTLRYKGYQGSIEVSSKDNTLFGEVLFISPLINYEAKTVEGLERAFHAAIEDYLNSCLIQGTQS